MFTVLGVISFLHLAQEALLESDRRFNEIQRRMVIWPQEVSLEKAVPPRLDYGAYFRKQDALVFCVPIQLSLLSGEDFKCENILD